MSGTAVAAYRLGCGYYSDDLAQRARENQKFRVVLSTTKTQQVTLMHLKPGESIGAEVHPEMTQMIYVVDGSGTARVGRGLYSLQAGASIVVPPGEEHDAWAEESSRGLWMFSVYSYGQDHGAPHEVGMAVSDASPDFVGYVAGGYLESGAVTHRVKLFQDGRYEFYHAGAEADGERQVSSALAMEVFSLVKMFRWKTGVRPRDPGADRGYAYFYWGDVRWLLKRDAPQLQSLFLKIDRALAVGPGSLSHGHAHGNGQQQQNFLFTPQHGFVPLMCEYVGCEEPVIDEGSQDIYVCPRKTCDAVYCSMDCYVDANWHPSHRHECGAVHSGADFIGRGVDAATTTTTRRLENRRPGGDPAHRKHLMGISNTTLAVGCNPFLSEKRFFMDRGGHWRPCRMIQSCLPAGDAVVMSAPDDPKVYRAYYTTSKVVRFELSSDSADPVRRWLRDDGDFNVRDGNIATAWAQSLPMRYDFEVPEEDADEAAKILEDHGYVDAPL